MASRDEGRMEDALKTIRRQSPGTAKNIHVM